MWAHWVYDSFSSFWLCNWNNIPGNGSNSYISLRVCGVRTLIAGTAKVTEIPHTHYRNSNSNAAPHAWRNCRDEPPTKTQKIQGRWFLHRPIWHASLAYWRMYYHKFNPVLMPIATALLDTVSSRDRINTVVSGMQLLIWQMFLSLYKPARISRNSSLSIGMSNSTSL